MTKKHRLWLLVPAVLGVLLVVASFVWSSVAVSRLVKYPDDVDETPRYEGTVTLYVDPATTAPLAEPREVPLTVSRNIRVVESTSDLAVVKETIGLKAEGLFDTVQENQYVMDRRSMQNVKDDRSWAFEPSNIVDRSPDYRLNFPLDNGLRPYPIYGNETASTYDASPSPDEPTGEVAGLDVHNYVADYDYRPATEAYLASLDKALPAPLPRQLSLEQLNPLLAKAGIDIPRLLPALLPALSTEDRAAVVALAQQPIKLTYLFRGSGADSAEVTTGGIVEVRDVVQTLAAAPDPTLLPQLSTLLGRYAQVEGVRAAIDNLQKLSAEPIKLFDNDFTQTEESVAEIAATVKDNADLRTVAETTVPWALRIAGIVLAVLGFVLFFAWRKPVSPAAPPPATPPVAPPPPPPGPGAAMAPPPASTPPEPPSADAADDATVPPPPGGSIEPPSTLPRPGGPAT